jgi:RimJ/RimL family protein N-acetyltransferase
MRHEILLEDFDVRLRPVRMDDAAFIVWLRNLDYVKGKVGDSAVNVAGQEAWLRTYFEREGDYYFVGETPGGIPLGTIGVYDVEGASGEIGRYIVRPEVMAGVPVAVLARDLAFGRLGLTELRSTSVSTNVAVHSLDRKFGSKQVGILREAQIIDGKPVDLVQLLLMAEDWFRSRNRLLPIARQAGTQVLEWEKTQLGKIQPWNETNNQMAV